MIFSFLKTLVVKFLKSPVRLCLNMFINLFFAISVVGANASEANTDIFSVEQYLEQVWSSSNEIQILKSKSLAATKTKELSSLVFQPYLTAGGDYTNSKETGFFSFLSQGDVLKTRSYHLGLSKEWGTGTSTSIQQRFVHFETEAGASTPISTWQNQLDLRIEQDLWRNFLGRETRGGEENSRHLLEAQSKRQTFLMRAKLVEAEIAYWNYALFVETSSSVRDSLKRAEGILQWNKKRFKAKLIDQGDLLQSEARVLELKQVLAATKTQEKQSRRLLAYFLNKDLEARYDAYALSALKVELSKNDIPEGWEREKREDLEAAYQAMLAARADSKSVRSSLDPEVKLVGHYLGDSADAGFSDAQSQAWDGSFREYSIGLQVSIPLGIPRQLDVREAKKLEADAAQLEFRQTEQQLSKRFFELREDLEQLIEKVQLGVERKVKESKKLANEEKRFRQGRSTSFQVLSFQEDLAKAELELIQFYAEARRALAELKLFSS